MVTRREIVAMTDMGLQLAFERHSTKLQNAWVRCDAGSLEDAFAVALLHTEAVIRGIRLQPAGCAKQLVLTDG